MFCFFSWAIFKFPSQSRVGKVFISCCYDHTDFCERWKWFAAHILNYVPPGAHNCTAFFANVYCNPVEQAPKSSSPDEESEATESCFTLETSTHDKPVPSPYTRDLLSWARYMAFKADGHEVIGEVKLLLSGILHEL